MNGYYYMWKGIGGIDEDELDGVTTDEEAIEFFRRWASLDYAECTWTLWHILDGRARMVAYCAIGPQPVVVKATWEAAPHPSPPPVRRIVRDDP